MKGNTREKPLNKKILADWDDNFQSLVEYKKEFGNCDVPFLWERNKKLANWVGIQRNVKNKLSPGQRKKLVGLGFDFTIKAETWEDSFKALQQFSRDKGHIHLPLDDPQYAGLREWLLKQTLDKDYLPKERLAKLEALGIEWTNRTLRSGRWLEMYGRLQEFNRVHGHSRVPQKWEEDPKLSNWVCVQRRTQSQGKLSRDRKKKLDRLGFVWSFKEVYDDQWEHFYKLLLAFKKKHGHCVVSGKRRKLASWVDRQRTAKNNGKLSKRREKALNNIGFVWNFNAINEEAWQEKYGHLAKFKKKHGHCFVSINSKENKSLGHWVATQRKLEVKGKLYPDKKKKLDRMGFVWKKDIKHELYAAYESKWMAHCKKLQAYKEKWGTCQVSLKIDPALQRWTSLQRRLYLLKKLSSQRISKLNKLGFPWGTRDMNEAYWLKMYRALLDYHRRFGNTKVPWGWPENPQLAPWVHRMKSKRRELGEREVGLLNAINFEWTVKKRTVVSWEGMYGRLVKFKLKRGHTKVPVQWKEDPKLGKWVSRMRYDKTNLDPQRTELLNRVGFYWGNNKCQYKLITSV